MRSVEVDGARVLILGGSGVLGSLIAADLQQRGAHVMLSGRDGDRLRKSAAALGEGVPSVIGDLTQPHHADHVVQAAIDTMGGLDGVVNAAGVVAFGPLSELPAEALDELAAADLLGPLRVMRAAITAMDGGFLVNITGVVAEQPMPGISAYSAMKAGLSAATRALGKEVRRHGIHVLDARPPHTETGLATRPIAGSAPSFPDGLDPKHVAAQIVAGLLAGERELPSEAFLDG